MAGTKAASMVKLMEVTKDELMVSKMVVGLDLRKALHSAVYLAGNMAGRKVARRDGILAV